VHEAALDLDGGYAPCHRALQLTCGEGEPPDGAVCSFEANGHAARCIRARAPSEPHLCECVASRDSLSELVSAEEISGQPCEDALRLVCPQTRPLTEADRIATCDYFASCEAPRPGFTHELCLREAPDVCVACAAEQLAQATDGACPEQGISCWFACNALVPKEVAVAACEDTLDAREPLTDAGRCLCERCHPSFGRCVADDGCLELLQCADAQGCEGPACQLDPVCGPIVERYLETPSVGLALAVGSCPERRTCDELAPAAP
jgi:hypothetical protein